VNLRGACALVISALAFAGCSSAGSEPRAAGPAGTTTASRGATSTTQSTTATSTTATAPTSMTAPAPVTSAPAPEPTTATAPPTSAGAGPAAGAGTISPIDAATAARMHASWRPGCPVGLESLRLLRLRYRGFDGRVHVGEMVVHADVAADVVGVFGALFDAGFPIARMVLVDEYGGDDDRSTKANNTSAFNCRAVTGGGRWSQHAYGRAIDVNPVQNPYVYADGHVLDPAAAPYVDRGADRPGMIHEGDAVVAAFGAIGWGWGGRYSSIRDYQHFSATGG
jgi:hypothetical protein